MTAAEAIILAGQAGLTLAPDPGGLAVGGPKAARTALLPTLRPLAAEILARLLAHPEPREPSPGPCVPGPDSCAACGYIHGAIEPRPPCNGCARTDWTVAAVMDDGDRYCSRCLAGMTVTKTGPGAAPTVVHEPTGTESATESED